MVKRREAPEKKSAPRKPARGVGAAGDADDLYAALDEQGGFDDVAFDPADLDKLAAGDDQFFTGDDDSFDEPVSKRRGRKSRAPRPTARKSPARGGRPTGRPPLTPAVLLLNLLGALLVGALATLLFLIAAIAINAGLRAAGVDLAEVVPAQAIGLAAEPTAESASGTGEIAVLPASLCPDGDRWWASQSQTFDFFASIYYRVAFVATPPEDITRAIESAQNRRDTIRDGAVEPCVLPVRAQMLGGAEGMIRAMDAFVSGAPLAETRSQADDAFATLTATLPLLWDQEIVTAPFSPPALDVPRVGSEACSPAADGSIGVWWAVAGPAWAEFRAQIAQIDFATMEPQQSVAITAAMQAAYTTVDSAPAAGCAETLKALLLAGMNSHISAVNTAVMGEVEATRAAISTYWQNTAQVQAWLVWLGIDASANIGTVNDLTPNPSA